MEINNVKKVLSKVEYQIEAVSGEISNLVFVKEDHEKLIETLVRESKHWPIHHLLHVLSTY